MFRKLTPLLFALVAAAALTACDKPESDRKRAFQYQDPRAGVQKTDPDSLKPWKQDDADKAEADKAEGALQESGTDGEDGN